MMSKLVRIGRDAEIRRTAAGKAVIGLACVYDIGYGDNKKSQWIEVAIWEKKAEALAPFLLKGKQVVIHADDIELETYQKNDGTQGSKLKCRAINIDLTSGGQQQQQAPQQQYQQPQQQQQAPNGPPAGYQNQMGTQAPASDFNNDISEDIPF